MGKTLLGGVGQEGNIDLLNPNQREFLSGALGNAAPKAGEAYSQFLQPQSMGDYQDLFEQSYINPAVQALNRQIIPGIQQSFVDQNAGSSSALNQALAEAATDVTTNLGSQFGNFFQQLQQNKLGALGQLGGLGTARTFEPIVTQKQGYLPSLLGATGSILGGALGGGYGLNPFSWFSGR